jgi:hypothetical protein
MTEDPFVLGRPKRGRKASPSDRVQRLARFLIGGGSLFLLMGQGEAIFGAPVLVPALWWAYVSSPSRAARATFTLIAALVMAEVGWLLAYETSGEAQPLISLAPAISFAGVVIFFWFSGRARKDRPSRKKRATPDPSPPGPPAPG